MQLLLKHYTVLYVVIWCNSSLCISRASQFEDSSLSEIYPTFYILPARRSEKRLRTFSIVRALITENIKHGDITRYSREIFQNRSYLQLLNFCLRCLNVKHNIYSQICQVAPYPTDAAICLERASCIVSSVSCRRKIETLHFAYSSHSSFHLTRIWLALCFHWWCSCMHRVLMGLDHSCYIHCIVYCRWQAHGGLGVSQDTPLSHLYAAVRTLRIADGPDEVHLRTVAKLEILSSNMAKL